MKENALSLNFKKDFVDLQNHLREHGFVYPSSEIYGGLANAYDLGPLGTLMAQKIRAAWWNTFIRNEPTNVGLDSRIILNSEVWKASGHLGNFSDVLIENKTNGHRYRADHLIEGVNPDAKVATMSREEMQAFIVENIKEYEGTKTNWGEISNFNLMFETRQGPVANKGASVYLRPETAQGIFINFERIRRSMGLNLPFGVGQIGKAFRNEITPGNFIFRTREFEQMELERFVKPEESDAAYEEYLLKSWNFLTSIGLKPTSLRKHVHDAAELAHYSKGTTDIEFAFPFGWGELMGIANRGEYDLKTHAAASGAKLDYVDPQSGARYYPYVIEPSIGLERLMLALLVDAFEVVASDEEKTSVLCLNVRISPYLAAVLPLSKRVHSERALGIFQSLIKSGLDIAYEDKSSIGKRYRDADAIGTPFAITIDDETLQNNTVTVRERDTTNQITLSVNELANFLISKINS